MTNIPWEDDYYRGWYCENGTIPWKAGYLPERNFPPEYIKAWYHATTDETIPWDESPIPLSSYSVKPEDEYSVEADENAERAQDNRDADKERRMWGRYYEKMQEEWN